MATGGDAIRCVLAWDYADEAKARAVQRALAPDDAGYVRSRAEGSRLIAELEGATPMSLLHTIEDYLACVAVAEETVDAARA